MEFMMIISNPDIAKFISDYDNVTIFVDLEVLGKKERQGHLDTVKSSLKFSDVINIRKAAPNSNMLVRINPMNINTKNEIDLVIKSGANSIMFPMFSSFEEVHTFIKIVDGRAKAIPLFETSKSIEILPEIISKLEIKQLHIGLNDLHIDQGKNFLFEPLSDGFLEKAAKAIVKSNIKFGIGGVARAGDGLLSPEYILGEHVRLGSSAAILSRTFHKNAETVDQLIKSIDFKHELDKLEKIYNNFQLMENKELEKNRVKTWQLIKEIASKINNNKNIID
jgi:hypothetical protein